MEERKIYEIITEQIMKMEISNIIKDNPSFSKMIGDIVRLIPDVAPGSISMSTSENGIKISINNEEYLYDIKMINPDEINVEATKMQTIYMEDGKIGNQKDCVGINIKTTRDGEVEETRYTGSEKDIVGGIETAPSSSEKKIYTKNGVVRDIEIKKYKSMTIYDPSRVNSKNASSILYIAKTGLSKPDEEITISRSNFDVAFVCEKNSKGEVTYRSNVQINNEYGVSDMNIGIRYKEVTPVIEPFTPKLIEDIIKRERDPRTQEELRDWAKGRETFYYNAEDDPNYINIEQKKAKTI